jgi:predicted HicB family RNase H-like nuclease
MANKNKEKPSPKPNRTLTDQLNVRVPEELFRRVNSVAGAMGKSLTAFVTETLEERTKDHKTDVQRMVEREKSSKRWQ